jgi:regulator of sigma E protease
MNLLLALVLFSTSYLVPREVLIGEVLIEEVTPNSPAATAGIEAGDIVLSVNEQPVRNNGELHQYIMDNLGKETLLLIKHPDSTQESFQVIPRWEPPEGEGAIGIVIKTINATTVTRRYPLWQVIPLGATELVETVIMWVKGLVSMFAGEAPASIVGPVGIAQLTGEVARFGMIPLLKVAALISLILGIMNLFPLPAIDGGRITFLFLEWVRRGKRLSPKIEGMVHFIGLALFLLFFIAITYQDIIRLISGESLIP